MAELGWFAEDGVECAPALVNCERGAALRMRSALTCHAHCAAGILTLTSYKRAAQISFNVKRVNDEWRD